MIEVKIINKSNNPLPEYKTEDSAGMDLQAYLDSPIVIDSQEIVVIPTGLHIELPKGYEAQIRPRSGLAIKGITVANSPGTIDADYRGEIGVILTNISKVPFRVNAGDRIAQLVVAKYEKVQYVEVLKLSETKRGNGRYGHTGV